MPRAVYLFDIDGTLIDSPLRSGRRALERACLDAHGLESALAHVSLSGNTDPWIIEEAFRARRGRPPTEAETAAVLAAYLECLETELAHPDAVAVLPGVDGILSLLERRGALVGLATGNIQEGARLKLERAGLWRRFAFGGYGSDSALRAELVRVAIRRAEAIAGPEPLGAVIVIGDTPRDIAAAHAAGARAVAVATGRYGVTELAEAGADEVFPDLVAYATALSGDVAA